MFDEEVGKYKKRSTAKGQPRAKHKHEYITVRLVRKYEVPDMSTGKMKPHESILPTKVCQICGRIDYVDRDASYYVKEPVKGLPYLIFDKKLSDKALKLPIWVADKFEKFATPLEEQDD